MWYDQILLEVSFWNPNTHVRSKMCCPAFSRSYASSTVWLADTACKTPGPVTTVRLGLELHRHGFLGLNQNYSAIPTKSLSWTLPCCSLPTGIQCLAPGALTCSPLPCSSANGIDQLHSHGNKEGDLYMESFSSTCCFWASSESCFRGSVLCSLSRHRNFTAVKHTTNSPSISQRNPQCRDGRPGHHPFTPMNQCMAIGFWLFSWTHRISSLIFEAHQTNLPQTW